MASGVVLMQLFTAASSWSEGIHKRCQQVTTRHCALISGPRVKTNFVLIIWLKDRVT